MPLTRVACGGIRPLEIWDLRVRGKTLFECQQGSGFAADLVTALCELRSRTAQYDTVLPESLRTAEQFDSLFLTGNGAHRPGLVSTLRGAGFRCVVDADASFPGKKGAVRVAGTSDVLGIDVGQSAIKVWWQAREVRAERDWHRLPMASGLAPAARVALRPAFVQFFGEAVRALAQAPSPAAVVLALPTQVSADLTVATCSYPYPGPDARLVSDLLAAAELSPNLPTSVLNDAELAAFSAQAQGSKRGTLVLTLGFGVGAAQLAANYVA